MVVALLDVQLGGSTETLQRVHLAQLLLCWTPTRRLNWLASACSAPVCPSAGSLAPSWAIPGLCFSKHERGSRT